MPLRGVSEMVQRLLSQSRPSMVMKKNDSPHGFVSQVHGKPIPSAQLNHQDPRAFVPQCRYATAFDTSLNWK